MKDHRRTIPLERIRVSARHRVELGELEELAQSIRLRGLLHPVVVTSDLRLVAGQRRLEACRSLGWKEIPATVTDRLSDATALLAAERDENTCRKDMTPSEKVALGRALEALEKPKAEERMREGGRKAAPGRPAERSGKIPDVSNRQVRDLVGEAVGMSGQTYTRAKTVVEAAEGTVTHRGVTEAVTPEAQETAREAVEQMDETGKVATAYNKVAPKVGKSPTAGGARVEPVERAPNDTRRDRIRNEAHRDRFVTAMSKMAGFLEGFDGLDLARVCAALTDEERTVWTGAAKRMSGKLRALARALKGKE